MFPEEKLIGEHREIQLPTQNVFELGGKTVTGKTTSIVIPPNSNMFFDWRRTCQLSWAKTRQIPGANKTF